MINFLIMFLISSFLSLIVSCLGLLLVKKSFKNQNKLSPFECGFNPRLSSRGSFSLQFFLVSLIFIIFDIELILLFPFLSMNLHLWNFFNILIFLWFLFLLTLGLFFEWNEQMLNWLI